MTIRVNFFLMILILGDIHVTRLIYSFIYISMCLVSDDSIFTNIDRCDRTRVTTYCVSFFISSLVLHSKFD